MGTRWAELIMQAVGLDIIIIIITPKDVIRTYNTVIG